MGGDRVAVSFWFLVKACWCFDLFPSSSASRGARARASTARCAEFTTASWLDTLMKTGSESIEAILRRRRILLAGIVARMEDTRLPTCVMFGELVGGAGCVGGQEREWMRCFLGDLRAFGINADQSTTAAQDEGEWRKARNFSWRNGSLQRKSVCPNVTGRTNDRIALSKRVRAGSLAMIN